MQRTISGTAASSGEPAEIVLDPPPDEGIGSISTVSAANGMVSGKRPVCVPRRLWPHGAPRTPVRGGIAAGKRIPSIQLGNAKLSFSAAL